MLLRLPSKSCTEAERAPSHSQLRVKIQKQMAIREQKARRKNLTKYIPNAAQAIFTVRCSCRHWLLIGHPLCDMHGFCYIAHDKGPSDITQS